MPAAAIVQTDPGGPAECIPDHILYRHIRCPIRSVLDVCRLAEGRIRSGYIVVIAAQNNRRSNPSLAYRPVKSQKRQKG